jgi:hypothetical protein
MITHTMNVINATELYPYKWLKWQIWCYTSFIWNILSAFWVKTQLNSCKPHYPLFKALLIWLLSILLIDSNPSIVISSSINRNSTKIRLPWARDLVSTKKPTDLWKSDQGWNVLVFHALKGHPSVKANVTCREHRSQCPGVFLAHTIITLLDTS